VSGSEASAARALDAKKGLEEAGRIEGRRRGVEEEENGGGGREEEGGRLPSDARAPETEGAGPSPTPARTV
jgi:hypothetical protein